MSTQQQARGAGRIRANVVSIALSALILIGAGVTVSLSADSEWFTRAQPSLSVEGLIPSNQVGIFIRNMSISLLLFSGVITVRASTFVGEFAVAIFLGLAISVSAHTVGLATTVATTWCYSIFEFTGFIVAGAGGIYPLVATIIRRNEISRSIFRKYYDAVGEAIPFILVTILLLILAALVEGFVIGYS